MNNTIDSKQNQETQMLIKEIQQFIQKQDSQYVQVLSLCTNHYNQHSYHHPPHHPSQSPLQRISVLIEVVKEKEEQILQVYKKQLVSLAKKIKKEQNVCRFEKVQGALKDKMIFGKEQRQYLKVIDYLKQYIQKLQQRNALITKETQITIQTLRDLQNKNIQLQRQTYQDIPNKANSQIRIQQLQTINTQLTTQLQSNRKQLQQTTNKVNSLELQIQQKSKRLLTQSEEIHQLKADKEYSKKHVQLLSQKCLQMQEQYLREKNCNSKNMKQVFQKQTKKLIQLKMQQKESKDLQGLLSGIVKTLSL